MTNIKKRESGGILMEFNIKDLKLQHKVRKFHKKKENASLFLKLQWSVIYYERNQTRLNGFVMWNKESSISMLLKKILNFKTLKKIIWFQ